MNFKEAEERAKTNRVSPVQKNIVPPSEMKPEPQYSYKPVSRQANNPVLH